jgi:serine protease Do
LVRLDQSIADVARQFVRVRVLNMRGVNLNLFEFDYDLDWAALILAPDETVLGRFGGRDPIDPARYHTMPGLRYALEEALKSEAAAKARAGAGGKQSPLPEVDVVENYPGFKRMKDDACIHCHQAIDFRREALRSAGKWKKEMAWIYPLPDNLGLRLDPRQGNRLESVEPGSAANRLGLHAGDVLRRVNNRRVASFADVQYALHKAERATAIPIVWESQGRRRDGVIQGTADWYVTDISWRASTKRLGPNPSIHGTDLTPEQKQQLGLNPRHLAMALGPFQPPAARQAGLRPGDIIVGVDNHRPEMTAGQFDAYIRLEYQVGQSVTYNYLRGGQALNAALTLPASTN